MDNDVAIDIIIPMYNGIEYLREALVSIVEQTVSEDIAWKCWIGINGHEENSIVYQTTSALLREPIFKRFKRRFNILDLFQLKGKVATMLYIVKHHCTYSHICQLDADDVWLPNKLEEQLKYVSEFDVIGTNAVYFGDERPDLIGRSPAIPLGNITDFDCLQCNPMIASSLLIRKELATWSLDWENRLEDYELVLRLNKIHKATMFNCPDVLVKHRLYSGSAFNSNAAKSAESVRMIRALYSEQK